MKFSIVLTTYNNFQSLSNCLDYVLEIDYPNESFELIVVDDGSTDDSLKLLNKYKIKFESKKIEYQLLTISKNVGRIRSRILGAEKAHFSRIVLLDSQLRIDRKALQAAAKYSENEHIISNVFMDKSINLSNHVYYLLRKKLYAPYWGYLYPEVTITEDNFSKISKGTGGFITNKEDFLKFSKKLKGLKIENEDTKLFSHYLNNHETLVRSADVRFLYIQRSGLKMINHLIERGPRLVDFYFRSWNKYSFTFAVFNLIAGFLLISLLSNLSYLVVGLLALFGLLFLSIVMFLSANLKDFFALILYLPILGISLYLGVINGLWLHAINKK